MQRGRVSDTEEASFGSEGAHVTVGTKGNHTRVLRESDLGLTIKDWNLVREMGSEKCMWG